MRALGTGRALGGTGTALPAEPPAPRRRLRAALCPPRCGPPRGPARRLPWPPPCGRTGSLRSRVGVWPRGWPGCWASGQAKGCLAESAGRPRPDLPPPAGREAASIGLGMARTGGMVVITVLLSVAMFLLVLGLIVALALGARK